MNFIPAKCPNCGGELRISDTLKDKFFCQYCGGLIMVEQAVKLAKSGAAYVRPEDFVVEGGVLKEYHGDALDVVIPSNVVIIAQGVFAGTAIRSVQIPSSVRDIQYEAFARCPYLEHVSISEGLENFNFQAFGSPFTAKGSSINIPSTVRSAAGPSLYFPAFGAGNHLTLIVDGDKPAFPASGLVHTGAERLAVSPAFAKELAQELVKEAARMADERSDGKKPTYGFWKTKQVVVPGVLDYVELVDPPVEEEPEEDWVDISADFGYEASFDEDYSYGKFFVDTMLTVDEVRNVWHSLGFYQWG